MTVMAPNRLTADKFLELINPASNLESVTVTHVEMDFMRLEPMVNVLEDAFLKWTVYHGPDPTCTSYADYMLFLTKVDELSGRHKFVQYYLRDRLGM